ncbi:MAG: hypothetical protein H0W65_08375 [Sphingomonas sp.]|uniref:hypothetical protein n=1 Tax=Sphingomonas sp. TaxID=28214 RepID=UPI00179BCAD9|nr:hypothetical protein [Sphingomonas sp.]MBA3667723.1 hypothetical protein [Sphingomonas sp.]
MRSRFISFVAIDWSGAKGTRHKGIAIAEARCESSPRLIRPGHNWSREEVADWLVREAAKRPTLFGFDFSFAPPIVERGEYLPEEAGVPTNAREFWAYVDAHCSDDDLGAASFLETAHRKHFYFGIADGVKADFMHFRQCDARLNAQGGRKTASAYDAIGAAQVAKASFAGMRMLHAIDDKIAIWPMDPLPDDGSAVVEIYTRIYLRNAGLSGAKVRSRSELNRALKALGSPPAPLRAEPNDHQSDALITAAGMRQFARTEPNAFAPPGLTPAIARSEGWTFGVV